MADARFSIPKKFGASEVTFFKGDSVNEVSIPVNGIEGLAGYGFVSLLEAQTTGGPKTPEYVTETAANLCVYLATAWRPGDSVGIMRRKFQLARALAFLASKKQKKTVTFASVLPAVVKLTDLERQAVWLRPDVAGTVAAWNAKGERKSVDVSATFRSIVG